MWRAELKNCMRTNSIDNTRTKNFATTEGIDFKDHKDNRRPPNKNRKVVFRPDATAIKSKFRRLP